jgi:hypothetical protein
MTATIPSSQPRPAIGSAYLVHPAVDVAAVLGGGLTISLALYVLWRLNSGFLVGAALFAICLDLPHVFQTSLRILCDPQERALHGRHYFSSLAAIAAATTSLTLTGNLRVLLIVWIVWQVFHVVKQHFGLVAIYATKTGCRDSRTIARYTLILGCLAPVLYRFRAGMRFADYVVFGHRMSFANLALPANLIPAAAVAAVYVAAAVCAAILIVQQYRSARAHRPTLPAMSWATLLLAVASYNLSYLFVTDLYALILIATSVHSLQYHLISWRRNHGRFAARPDEAQRLLLGRLSRREAWPAYTLFLLVAGLLLANGEIVLLGLIPLTLTFHHFYMDGFIWKGKLNPTLAADLGLWAARDTVRV